MSDLLQFLVNTPVQPRAKFYSGGPLTDLDGPAGGTCTVTLTKPDGSAGPVSGTVSHVATGIYSFQLDGPTTPTTYDITWAGQIGGEDVSQDTQAEAVGEFLFTLTRLRELRVVGEEPMFADSNRWPEERLMEERTATLDEFTKILWFSPVPRHGLATLNGDGTAAVQLPDYQVHQILACKVDGTALTVGELADLHLQSRMLRRKTLGVWPDGVGNITVEYVHGWKRPLGDGSSIGMLRAAMRLDPGLSQSAASVVTPDGVSYSFDPAGQVTRAGLTRHFGVPAIDSWLNRHKVA